MVIRKRLRSILVPLALYAASGTVAAYFVFHAHHGQRGLEAKREIKRQIFELTAELNELHSERAAWERRIALMQDNAIDRDLLDERARSVLGMAHPNDIVVMIGPRAE